jgi:hypothetical protein
MIWTVNETIALIWGIWTIFIFIFGISIGKIIKSEKTK